MLPPPLSNRQEQNSRQVLHRWLTYRGKFGLVLDGNSPEVDSLFLILREVFGDVVRVGLVNLGAGKKSKGLSRAIELLLAVHGDLHPRRWAPRARKHLDGVDGPVMGRLQEGHQVNAIRVERKVL